MYLSERKQILLDSKVNLSVLSGNNMPGVVVQIWSDLTD